MVSITCFSDGQDYRLDAVVALRTFTRRCYRKAAHPLCNPNYDAMTAKELKEDGWTLEDREVVTEALVVDADQDPRRGDTWRARQMTDDWRFTSTCWF